MNSKVGSFSKVNKLLARLNRLRKTEGKKNRLSVSGMKESLTKGLLELKE